MLGSLWWRCCSKQYFRECCWPQLFSSSDSPSGLLEAPFINLGYILLCSTYLVELWFLWLIRNVTFQDLLDGGAQRQLHRGLCGNRCAYFNSNITWPFFWDSPVTFKLCRDYWECMITQVFTVCIYAHPLPYGPRIAHNMIKDNTTVTQRLTESKSVFKEEHSSAGLCQWHSVSVRDRMSQSPVTWNRCNTSRSLGLGMLPECPKLCRGWIE